MEDTRYFTLQKSAQKYRISVSTARRLAKTNQIPSIQIGKRYLFKEQVNQSRKGKFFLDYYNKLSTSDLIDLLLSRDGVISELSSIDNTRIVLIDLNRIDLAHVGGGRFIE